ncbi:STAS domain-containing protein [Streptomyces sp. NPDC005227]|uniref:STAS domain-containing protein n=1 Tax=unclassified Streptomyces TaxID=2593676 RepID=UPI0036B5DE75
MEQAARLSVARTDTAGIRVLTLRGEMDADTIGLLRHILQSDGGTSARWVLDLSGTTFMDSSAIEVLFVARRDTAAAGGWIRMAGLTALVQRVVEIVGLDTVIECYPTLPQALAA